MADPELEQRVGSRAWEMLRDEVQSELSRYQALAVRERVKSGALHTISVVVICLFTVAALIQFAGELFPFEVSSLLFPLLLVAGLAFMALCLILTAQLHDVDWAEERALRERLRQQLGEIEVSLAGGRDGWGAKDRFDRISRTVTDIVARECEIWDTSRLSRNDQDDCR